MMKLKNIFNIASSASLALIITGCSVNPADKLAKERETLRLIGEAYEIGDSLHSQNMDSAFTYYEKAALLSDSAALARIVPALYEGIEIKQDINKCLRLASIGDSINEPVCQYVLALCYESGTGVETSMEQTIQMLEKSASGNFIPAQYRLGWHKFYEVGMTEDKKEALQLWEKAAAKDYPMAILQLGHYYDYLAEDSIDYEKAKALYNKGIELLENLAKEGDVHSLYTMGKVKQYSCGYTSKEAGDLKVYYKQLAMKKDAFPYFESAAEKGYAPAMTFAGFCYIERKGTKNYEKAMDYFKKAAEKHDAMALYGLGILYENGFGVQKDYSKALEYYFKGAQKGDGNSMGNLGFMYSKGLGVEKDVEKKFEWYQKSSDLNNCIGTWNLAVCYDHGLGVPKDKELSEKYFHRNWLCNSNFIIFGGREVGTW